MTGRACVPAALVGLVGSGIQLSRTPRMHEAEAEAQGLRLSYRLFDTGQAHEGRGLAEILDAAELCGFAGLNVTFPHKIAAMGHVDTLSDAARSVGAINTVVFRDGRRSGHNTDMWGFAESFRRGMDGAGRDRVLLIGAGGAGVAVAHALMECGVGRLLIADTDRARQNDLLERLAATHPGRAEAAGSMEDTMGGALDGVVNATPVGMAKLPGSPVPAELLRPEMWVADIVYFPLETDLLREARRRGCKVLPGAGMAVFQAARAFKLFTGLAADPERMRATFESFTE
ncbi:shikimate dehydrogenase [Rhodobacteraceae bacterium WD3A24]|nr:shikimate dehydrogenase [Rhodobacteraceae bacterium WD3A24]